ncbi:MAG: carbohydrate porin [Phycisphaerae bacterium]
MRRTYCLLLLVGPMIVAANEPGDDRSLGAQADAAAVEAASEETVAEPAPAKEVRPSRRTQLTQWCHENCATGRWGGVRDQWEEKGVTLSLEYVSTLFVDAKGGANTHRAIEYTGNTHLTLSLDTGALGWWDGGEVFVYAEERHGSGITERHVGDLFTLNNDEERDFVQVSEYWWRQEWFGGKVWSKVGKMDAAGDFQVVEYGLEFINSVFGVFPTVPVPTFPDTALGVVAAVEPADWLYFMAGVFDQQAFGGTSGFDTAFHDRADTVTMFELALMPELEIEGRSYPGTYRIGGWYTSGDEDVFFNDLDGRLRPRTHRGNAGLYLAFDQLIYKENDDPGDDQGIGAFFQFGWVPSAYNEISQYYGAGIQWIGALPDRNDDILGLAMGHGHLSGRVQSLEARYSETVVELFYKAQLTPWFSLMPDLQYIVNPGGDGRDAFVVGVRTQISF